MANAIAIIIGCIGGHTGGYGSKGSACVARIRMAHWMANRIGGDARGYGSHVLCAESACRTPNRPLFYGDTHNAHIIAEGNGGHYCTANIVLTCADCNLRRGDTDMVYGDVRANYVHPEGQASEGKSRSWHRMMMG